MELEQFLREVEIQTEVFITLQQQYELARIEEVKETQSLVILDEGKTPAGKDKPKRTRIVILAIILGGLLGLATSLENHTSKNNK